MLDQILIHFLSRHACHSLAFLFFISSDILFAQTQAKLPVINFMAEGQSHESDQSYQGNVDAEIPIPVALDPGMLFLRTFANTRRFAGDSPLPERSYLMGLNLLHHAAEGAPLWKVGAGYLTNSQRQSASNVDVFFNLEKLFPFLRPNGSDRAHSWIGFSSFHNENSIVLPEFGWSWVTKDNIIFDIIAPRLIKLGYMQGEWTCSGLLRQDSIILWDQESSSRLGIERRRYYLAEVARTFGHGFLATFGAGMSSKNAPVASFGITWKPAD
jgi:hypothetical protein